MDEIQRCLSRLNNDITALADASHAALMAGDYPVWKEKNAEIKLLVNQQQKLFAAERVLEVRRVH